MKYSPSDSLPLFLHSTICTPSPPICVGPAVCPCYSSNKSRRVAQTPVALNELSGKEACMPSPPSPLASPHAEPRGQLRENRITILTLLSSTPMFPSLAPYFSFVWKRGRSLSKLVARRVNEKLPKKLFAGVWIWCVCTIVDSERKTVFHVSSYFRMTGSTHSHSRVVMIFRGVGMWNAFNT